MITLLEPQRLWLLLAVGAVVIAYVRGHRRRAAYPVTLSTTAFAVEARRRRGRAWSRHVPAAALVGLLALLVVGFARPALITTEPSEGIEVVVALDTSASMGAEDVDPSREQAAREAARDFVEQLPDSARVGVVAFAGGASLALAPTENHDRALDALENADGPGQGTAIGEAVAVGVAALDRGRGPASSDPGADAAGGQRLVLLSDGDSTVGRPVERAAAEATAAGIRVDTIAFGTPVGTLTVQGEQIPVPVQDASLSALAASTGGELRAAGDTGELAEAYEDIVGSLGEEERQHEITGWVGLLAAVLAAVVAWLGLRRAALLPGRPGRGARSAGPAATTSRPDRPAATVGRP